MYIGRSTGANITGVKPYPTCHTVVGKSWGVWTRSSRKTCPDFFRLPQEALLPIPALCALLEAPSITWHITIGRRRPAVGPREGGSNPRAELGPSWARARGAGQPSTGHIATGHRGEFHPSNADSSEGHTRELASHPETSQGLAGIASKQAAFGKRGG
ncbi:hypothetical protein Bbelb_301350 [Branchiostoma belcheri]|nr:hypothetical protein Bbelb_301350 [Branchiostoma belcheri]